MNQKCNVYLQYKYILLPLLSTDVMNMIPALKLLKWDFN